VSPVDDFVKIVAADPAFFVSAWLHASATYAKSPAADHQPGPGRGD
jgi:hypothetical protein